MITNQTQLTKILENCIKKMKEVLSAKNKEYSDGEDRLANFRRSGGLQGICPEKALIGMWSKHVVSIIELAKWAETEDPRLTEKIVDEKIIDAMNYLVLLRALLAERIVPEITVTLEGSYRLLRFCLCPNP